MTTRASKSTAIFFHPFALTGYSDELPAGGYEIFTEEERHQGLSFSDYQPTATYLKIPRSNRRIGADPTRETTLKDLEIALCRDRELIGAKEFSRQSQSP